MNIKMIDPDKIDCKIPEPQVWNGKFILPWGNERLSINQAPESPKKGMKVDRNSIPSKEVRFHYYYHIFPYTYTYFQWTEDGQGFQIQYLTLDT